MPQRGPLQWVDGEGWLILSGGGDWQRGETDAVTAHILSIANLDRPMVVLLSEGERERGYELLEYYARLGGPGGEVVILEGAQRQRLNEPRLLTAIAEAGILHLGGARPWILARGLRNTPALAQILKGYGTLQGLLIVGVEGGAAALGAWIAGSGQETTTAPGLGLVRSAIIAPQFTTTEEAPALRAQLRQHPGFVGLGIPRGVALALGPQGQVETWGEGAVTAVVHEEAAAS